MIQIFRLRLNPKKSTFGVTYGKLLGHMVSERGIEVEPDKIKAILDMLVSRTKKDIRGFLSRLQYINRFIARLTNICESIFRLLKKNQHFGMTIANFHLRILRSICFLFLF